MPLVQRASKGTQAHWLSGEHLGFNFYLVSLWLAITLFRLKGLTRLEECDSCNQDDSGEERFQQHAAGHFGDAFVQSEQKLEEKATLTKLPHISQPAPDEKGKTKKLV